MIENFGVFIISYKRYDILKTHTFKLLKTLKCKYPIYIILSDDDPTIRTYERIYGKENIIIFNKDEAHKLQQTDLGDTYHSMKSCGSFARNYVFEAAKLKGCRYFLSLDDDFDHLCIRGVMGDALHNYRVSHVDDNFFEELCEKFIKVLNSQPYLYCIGLSQLGDYIGGLKSGIYKFGYKFKAMGSFFCDTQKEYRYPGRFNDDVCGYITNNIKGRISLILHGFTLSTALTQNVKGGMTEIYRQNGTYLKSLYSSIMLPSVAKLKPMGESIFRMHHLIKYRNDVPKILNEKFSKNKYKSEVPSALLDKKINFSDINYSFSKEDCFLKDDIELW